MTCITAFKINIARINDDEMYEIIDLIGVEPGITEQFLYYGLLKKDTDYMKPYPFYILRRKY